MNNQIKPIDLIADELNKKTIELAHYKVAYSELSIENERLKELEELINSNADLKELVEEAKAKVGN